MPSIIPGFQYDIFISYRHNDNRSGWVTDFVNALQEELAATIKGPISIYFDQNPHDGLLETHNVDRSLEGKLKCLIFIPIISQTYCDTKSFAWQHEFLAFNKLSKEDQFGRDIKLSNGNVASRILPIKIHDLDAEDKSIIENEIGGVLRAIELIYKEAGVNRPLKSTDSKNDNQNKTDYRNQVNKVANAIKEIINALKNPSSTPSTVTSNGQSKTANTQTSIRKKAIITSLLALLIAVIGYFIYQQTTSNQPTRQSGEQPTQLDKSIAVLPFADLSPEGDQEYLGDGISEEIINVLAQSPDLKVIARSSSFQFKGKNEDLRTIGKMLGVSTILDGSVRKFKDQVRVTAQLINVKDGSHFWSKNFDQHTNNTFDIQDGIAAEVASALKITLLKSGTTKHTQEWNEKAQQLYQQGRYFYDRTGDEDIAKAYELMKQSVALDSNQAISQLYLSTSFNNYYNPTDVKGKYNDTHLKRALALDPNLSDAYAMQALHYFWNFNFDSAKYKIDLALNGRYSTPMTFRTAARIFVAWGKPKEAMELADKAIELDPLQQRSLVFGYTAYYQAHNFKVAHTLAERAKNISPTDGIYGDLIYMLLLEKKVNEAEQLLGLIKNSKRRAYDSTLVASWKEARSQSRQKSFETLEASSYQKATLYAVTQNRDQALLQLEIAFKEKDISMVYLSTDPFFDPLRKDPRFIKLLKKLNYPEIK